MLAQWIEKGIGTAEQVNTARDLISEISRATHRIERARASRSISEAELVQLLKSVALVVKYHVRDPDTLEAIAKGWESLRVKYGSNKSRTG
jgi:hypothetical protein